MKRSDTSFTGAFSFSSLTHLLTYSLLLLFPVMVQACPLCKEALFDPGELAHRLSAAKGYALSITLLLSVPFGLIVTVATLILRSCRRGRAAPTPPHDPANSIAN